MRFARGKVLPPHSIDPGYAHMVARDIILSFVQSMVWLGSGLGLVEVLYGVAKSCTHQGFSSQSVTIAS